MAICQRESEKLLVFELQGDLDLYEQIYTLLLEEPKWHQWEFLS